MTARLANKRIVWPPTRKFRYGLIKAKRVKELAYDFLNEADSMDLSPELAAARAIFSLALEDYEKLRRVWNKIVKAATRDLNNPGEEKARLKIQDLAPPSTQNLNRMIETIAKIEEQMLRLHDSTAVPRSDVIRLVAEMMRVVALYVPDENVVEKIREAWADLTLTK